ncbi:MFS transporter [Nocardioides mesophilus]|uniref:MFS transporter n=1 Tax=Nocardioides mesophilus TaxID=433659 RepID=A0A7G9RAP8_9ACTN|nr:MFS transporter [Nocardioides mesophilus]QNN52673.1 MFS transporter [Nocardioides mesophilus]
MTDISEEAAASPLTSTRSAVRSTGDSLRSVFRNPNLRRVQLALAGSMIGDWAYATAVAVWAYGVGGTQAVGIWTAIRLTLLAFTSPIGATIADRLPRKKVMIGSDLTRAVLVMLAALCLFLDLPAATVFVLATLASLSGTAFRPAQRALMPALANRPEELTASNGTASTLESLAFFVGPALGALLLGVADVPVVFLVNAGTFLWSALFVVGVRVPAAAAPRAKADADDEDTPKQSFLTETLAGFRTILADRDLLVVTTQVSAQTVVAGASAVFTIVMAVDILGSGPRGVGYLDSVLGVGAIVGGFLAIARATRLKLAQDMTAGVVLWALPLLLVSVWPHPVAAFVAVALLGLGNPLVDVNMDTIFQRIAPDEVLGRVFGAVETCLISTMALGAVLMPLLESWLGLRTALAVLGTAVTVVALTGLPRMRRLDDRLTRPVGIDLLQAIPMFAPLTPAVLETLARRLTPVVVPAGEVFIREGEPSDRFYVISSGSMQVTQDTAVLRTEGPGDFFGEIGLLRDVPRTATLTAVEETELLALERDDFLDAVTGQIDARSAAEDIVTRRLAV